MRSIIFLLLLLFFYSCSNNGPTSTLQNDEGQIIFSVKKNTIISMIGFIKITLSNSQYSSIEKEFKVNDTSFGEIRIPNLPIGTWTIIVKIYNSNESLIFTGQTDVEVTKDGITPVEILTNPFNGDIIMSGVVINQLLNSLITFYPFSGNANDYSGNEINGFSYGPKLIEDRFGNSNSAYFFNGVNDFIDIKRDKKLNLESDLTISVWIKPESFEGISNAILNYQADNTDNPGTNNLFSILFRNGNNKLTYIHESFSGINHFHTFENFNFISSLWYHVIIVRNVNKKIVELFVNGEKKDQIEYLENPSDGSLSYLRIGEFQGTVLDERFFHGAIDDIVILNKTISAEEIKYFYAMSK